MRRIIEPPENKRHYGRKNAATFVFQGATGGAIGVFFFLTFMVLRHPQPYNLIPFLLFLPFVIFLGGVIGAVKGIAYCLSVRFFRLNPQVLVRVGAAVGFTASLGLLWANIAGVTDWRMLIDLSAPGLFIGVPTGLLVGSRIRPWRTIVFGAEEQRRPEFAHDDKGTVPTSRFSVLAGLPLRLATLLGFSLSLFSFACVWSTLQRRDFLGFVFAISYFAASAYVAFRPPRRWTLLFVAVLLNAPLLILIRQLQSAPVNGSQFYIVLCCSFILLWAALLFTYAISPVPRRKVVLERWDGHECLGSRFTDWLVHVNA